MSDEIKPALTSEEWSGEESWVLSTESPKCGHFVALEKTGNHLEVHVVGPVDFTLSPDDCVRMMAMCNAVVPDGHRLKITREDVAMLRNIHVVDEYGDDAGTDPGLQRLAAKLAALLPPEG